MSEVSDSPQKFTDAQSAIPELPTLNPLWQELGWQPIAEQQAQFQQLYEGVLQGNQQFNLTRITEPLEFWEKHLWDSLSGIAPLLEESIASELPQRAIDIGTGAGFPGIPVAIACPTWHVTLLDSTRKKVQFLETVAARLGLTNVATRVDRVEAIGQQPQHREQYDLALVRAVAAAAVCAEYALPLLKIGGLAVLYRGLWTEEETAALEPVAQQLGGTVERVAAFKTPITQGERHCLYLRKVASTPPQFPRAVGTPAQKPLGSGEE